MTACECNLLQAVMPYKCGAQPPASMIHLRNACPLHSQCCQRVLVGGCVHEICFRKGQGQPQFLARQREKLGSTRDNASKVRQAEGGLWQSFLLGSTRGFGDLHCSGNTLELQPLWVWFHQKYSLLNFSVLFHQKSNTGFQMFFNEKKGKGLFMQLVPCLVLPY